MCLQQKHRGKQVLSLHNTHNLELAPLNGKQSLPLLAVTSSLFLAINVCWNRSLLSQRRYTVRGWTPMHTLRQLTSHDTKVFNRSYVSLRNKCLILDTCHSSTTEQAHVQQWLKLGLNSRIIHVHKVRRGNASHSCLKCEHDIDSHKSTVRKGCESIERPWMSLLHSWRWCINRKNTGEAAWRQ